MQNMSFECEPIESRFRRKRNLAVADDEVGNDRRPGRSPYQAKDCERQPEKV